MFLQDLFLPFHKTVRQFIATIQKRPNKNKQVYFRISFTYGQEIQYSSLSLCDDNDDAPIHCGPRNIVFLLNSKVCWEKKYAFLVNG